ncbi:MAG: hypothetical protein ABJD97_12565 [Betaproteobacteria bacterium]
MLLVWGRRWYTSKLGFVADFCEICRRPQPFQLERLSLIGHFWYVPMGTTHAVRHQGRCTRCDTEMATEHLRYATVAKKKSASTRELLDATLPDHERVLERRIAAERLVRDNVTALPADSRQYLLARPFVTLSPMVEQRFANMHLDLWSGLSALSLFVFPGVFHGLWSVISPDTEELGALAGLVASAGFIMWTASGAKRRWIRRVIASRLVDSLAPLKASAAEIEGIIAELRTHDHKLGKYLRASDLQRRRA